MSIKNEKTHHTLNMFNIKQSIIYGKTGDTFSEFYNLSKYNDNRKPVLIIDYDNDRFEKEDISIDELNHGGLIYQIIFDKLPSQTSNSIIYLINSNTIPKNRTKNMIEINIDDYLSYIKTGVDPRFKQITKIDYKLFLNLNIKRVYISSWYNNYEDFTKKYNLQNYDRNLNVPLLFIGLHNSSDYNVLDTYDGQIFFIWDSVEDLKKIEDFSKKYKKVNSICLDNNSYEVLKSYSIFATICNIDFCVEHKTKAVIRSSKVFSFDESNKSIMFSKYNINQIYISTNISHLDRIRTIYNLNPYSDTEQPLLIFGLYSSEDFKTLVSHVGQVYLMWSGTDCDDTFQIRKNVLSNFKSKYPNVRHFSISNDINRRLLSYNITSELIDLDLTNYDVFKPVDTCFCDTIYIFNGLRVGEEKIYGEQLYKQIQSELSQFKYILSSKQKFINNEEMFDVYNKCFIGLRLTSRDGNANMVREMLAMNIPVVHNGDFKTINWTDVDSIKTSIMRVYNKNYFEQQYELFGIKNSQYTYDLFTDEGINSVDLDSLNSNINDFLNLVKSYNNILILSSDFPGYGGAGTNADALQNFLNINGHNTYSIYYNYTDDPNKKYVNSAKYCVIDQSMIANKIKTLHFTPDLVLLKTPAQIDLSEYVGCPIIYCIGGIFLNSLDIHVSQLNTKEEIDKYINTDVLLQASKVNLCLVNSIHTGNILKTYYNIKSYVFYSGFVGYVNTRPIVDPNFNNRQYIFGIIVSDFTRKIKNIDGCLEFINKYITDPKRVVLIGTNSNMYSHLGYEIYDLLSREDTLVMYSKIQYVIQDSFYESCSNVMVESYFNGCKTKKDYLYQKQNIVDNNIIDTYPVDDNPIDDNPVDDNPVDDNPVDDNPVDNNPDTSNNTGSNSTSGNSLYGIESFRSNLQINLNSSFSSINVNFNHYINDNYKPSNNLSYSNLLLHTDKPNFNITLQPQTINLLCNPFFSVDNNFDHCNSQIICDCSIPISDEPTPTNEPNIEPIEEDLENIPDNSILLVSTQYAYYGGAATLVYELHKKFLDQGINSVCLFLNLKRIKYSKYNPKQYPRVYSRILIDHNRNDMENYYIEFTSKLSPKFIIGFNYIAPIIAKKMYPNIPTFYFITGSKYISDSNITAFEYINESNRYIEEINSDENYCMNLVDFVIPNSCLTKNVFTKCYPHIKHKLTDVVTYEEIFFTDRKLDNEKIYDIAVISSRFDRGVKNINFIKELFNSPLLQKYSKICIGQGSEGVIDGADRHFGLVPIDEVNEIMAKTRVVLITSRYESMSISLMQGINNGCIVISNHNVGASCYLESFYIMNNFNVDCWAIKINTVLDGLDYHMKMFKNHYQPINLQKTIDMFQQYINKPKISRKNVVFISVDKPHDGGASNNVINMMTCFKDNKYILPIGLFIVTDYKDIDLEYYAKLNIYFCIMDKNIEDNIRVVLNQIKLKFYNIDLYFVKNYKAFTCLLRQVDSSQVLFSPSGLRHISTLTTYYNKTDLEKFFSKSDNTIEFDTSLDLYTFIQKYDVYLEKYIFGQLKYIMPNSDVTFDIIQNSYDVTGKLLPYVNITFIDYDSSKIDVRNWANRKYDIAFCCHSWKRAVKNYGFFRELVIALNTIKKYKILIVGLFQKPAIIGDNVSSIQHLDHNELIKTFKNVKLYCMNSFYDSNPNTLKEALQEGCQVLVTRNIGNFSMFDTNNIVDDPADLKEWCTKIQGILESKKPWSNPLKNNFKNNIVPLYLQNMIISIITSRDIKIINDIDNVGFYKLEPSWSGLSNVVVDESCCVQTAINYSFKSIIDSDLFFMYLTNFFDKYYLYDSEKNYHYVIVGCLTQPSYFNIKYYYPFARDNVYLWIINKNDHLNLFRKCHKFFFRGNYYETYHNLAPNKYKELYCATALFQDQKGIINIGKTIEYPFDQVLIEEDNYELYVQKFPNSGIKKYLKQTTTQFMALNYPRTIDYIFVATEQQPTKNRYLFVDFIVYCEERKLSVSFMTIGKHDEYFDKKLSNLKYVTYYNFDKLKANELTIMYNRSRINVILSGRDALPRVILEGFACGCYNIALDTLTDGKMLYFEPIGTILAFPHLDLTYNTRAKSVGYVSDVSIYDELIKFKYRTYDHYEISYKFYDFVEKYRVEVTK